MTTRLLGLTLGLALAYGCSAKPDDAEIALAVQRELTGEMNLTDVNAESVRGKVTLSGRVASEADRASAERSASAMKGVVAVSNQLIVITPTPSLPEVASPPPTNTSNATP